MSNRRKIVNVNEAKTNFSKLLKRIECDEEVIIARSGKPVARLSGLAAALHDRTPGSAKGIIRIANDFDAPMPVIEQAFEL
jgi:prevent-host-death family protein